MQLTIYHCSHCGGFVPEGRTDKKYCSNSCKQKHYRWRKKIESYASDMKRAANNIAAYLDYEETRGAATQALSWQRTYIQEIARQYGVIIKGVK